MEYKNYIDVDDALKRLMNNKQMYCKLLGKLMESNLFSKLAEEVENGDLEAALVTTHNIKGMCANLSIIALKEASAELELQLKQANGAAAFAEFEKVRQKSFEHIADVISQLA